MKQLAHRGQGASQRDPWITRRECALVRETWRKIALDDGAAEAFYDRLFALDPSLRGHFPRDMAAQKQKLMATLAHTVAYLDRFELLLDEVRALGERHLCYGASPIDYSTVGDALLRMLEQGLGAQWTRDAERAWEKTFTALSQTMIRAATRHEERSP
jgi:hemoglobin-like flavoprotein